MNSIAKTAGRALLNLSAAVTVACVLATSSASAGDDTRSETVKYADLNLGTDAGVQALYKRIHAAAWRVCEQPAGEQAATASCMKKSEGDAIKKVNAPMLTAFYQKKSGSRPQTITASR